jgi:hypothetical protein
MCVTLGRMYKGAFEDRCNAQCAIKMDETVASCRPYS